MTGEWDLEMARIALEEEIAWEIAAGLTAYTEHGGATFPVPTQYGFELGGVHISQTEGIDDIKTERRPARTIIKLVSGEEVTITVSVKGGRFDA